MREDRCSPLLASLEAWGIKSCVAPDCQKALQLLAEDSELSMILTAGSLPDGSWRDLARASAANKVRVPVVLCRRSMDGGTDDLLESGVLLLVEPFDFKSLQPVVAQAAQLWRHWNGKWPDAYTYSDAAAVPLVQAKPPVTPRTPRRRSKVRSRQPRRRRVNQRL